MTTVASLSDGTNNILIAKAGSLAMLPHRRFGTPRLDNVSYKTGHIRNWCLWNFKWSCWMSDDELMNFMIFWSSLWETMGVPMKVKGMSWHPGMVCHPGAGSWQSQPCRCRYLPIPHDLLVIYPCWIYQFSCSNLCLVGDDWNHGIWIDWNPSYWECHNPNWRTVHHFSEGLVNHQPVFRFTSTGISIEFITMICWIHIPVQSSLYVY